MDVRFVGGSGAQAHDAAEVVELLGRDDGFVWVDVPTWDDQVESFLEDLGCHPMVTDGCTA